MPNALFSERAALVATIDPGSQSTGEHTSAAVAVRDFHRLAFILLTGTLGTSATVDAKLQQSPNGSSGWTDIPDKALTQLTEAGSGSNVQAILECRADELDEGNTHVRALVTVGTAASHLALAAFGIDPRFEPAEAAALASLVEVRA